MKFEYDECCGSTEMVLSKEEIKLIKSKAKELRKICYEFGFFNFDVMSDNVSCHDGEVDDDEDDELTYEQVADRLGEVLPFVKEYRKKLVEDERLDELLHAIERYIEDIPVSIMGTPLSVEDICTEINENFGGVEIANALSKFCDKTTICKVYDYLKKQECDEDDECDEYDEDDEDDED